MKYTFLKFTLDSDTKELYANNQPITITKGQYDLLLFLLKNPGKMFSKDEIFDNVWQGRQVTENSIDQIISKLRKVLSTVDKNTCIKTVYGKGLMFASDVNVLEPEIKTKPTFNKPAMALVLSALIAVVFYFNYSTTDDNKPKSLLLFMSNTNSSTNDEWLNQGSSSFIDQLFNYANIAQLKDYKDKPEHLGRQQYINSQWEISPELKVVTTYVFQKNNTFTVELNIVDKQQSSEKQTFTDKNLATAMSLASKWLANEVDQSDSLAKLDAFIPQNSYTMELYLHGVFSLNKGEIDKADNYFQLCLTESPNFSLARLQLAQVKSAQGKQEESLAMLDTLLNSNNKPQIEIAIESLRGDIYDTQGKYEEARDLYLAVLSKYKNKNFPQLNQVRYNLSYTFSTLTEFDNALSELNKLETDIKQSKNPELLAHVLQKKASLLQKLGHMKEAQDSASKSLVLFSQLDDMLGEAKIYITLARISTHQSNYKKSVQHLEQALIINKSLNYKLGVGATINELIYVLMVQGSFSKAWDLNQEMQDIALEIDYNAMLQISKQYSVDISRALKKWKRSEIYLAEHLQLAKASDNKRAILKNNLLALDLYLDQKQTGEILGLIEAVQKHIDETGEIRLQPRINKQLAQYYLLLNENDQAIALLLSTKELAKKSQDGETIIIVNNMLAQHYIDNNQAQKALAVLEGSNEYDPLPYPFLLLKAKANASLGNLVQALNLSNECKNTSNQWWSIDDEKFHIQLQQRIN